MPHSFTALLLRALPAPFLLCATLTLPACVKSRSARAQPASASAAVETGEHPLLPAGSPLNGSLHDLDSAWHDQNDNALTLTDLPGTVRVVAMGYTSCRSACPRLLADMRRIEQTLEDKDSLTGVHFFFVSIDPERDTPERLKASMKENALSEDRWTFLTGDADSVLELAVVLGMKYQRATPGDFAHSNIITLLDEDGAILHQQVGMGVDPGALLEAIGETLAASSG